MNRLTKFVALGLLAFAGFAAAMDPFRPQPNGTQKISVGSSNTATALTTTGRTQYVLTTPATNTDVVFVDFGSSGSVSTTSASYPLLPGMKETVSVFGPPNGPTHISNISGSGTQVLYVTAGAGE